MLDRSLKSRKIIYKFAVFLISRTFTVINVGTFGKHASIAYYEPASPCLSATVFTLD